MLKNKRVIIVCKFSVLFLYVIPSLSVAQ